MATGAARMTPPAALTFVLQFGRLIDDSPFPNALPKRNRVPTPLPSWRRSGRPGYPPAARHREIRMDRTGHRLNILLAVAIENLAATFAAPLLQRLLAASGLFYPAGIARASVGASLRP